ncbi:hypothetical protein ACHAXT_004849 [Thalassiosira profunda]
MDSTEETNNCKNKCGGIEGTTAAGRAPADPIPRRARRVEGPGRRLQLGRNEATPESRRRHQRRNNNRTPPLPLPMVLEYSMDVLKAAPSGDLPELVGFDWGSCAWRHCGAKADAQEALAELHGSVGMLEPFECRFILDIVERSIRDVLAVVPADLKPVKDGVVVQAKPYVPYVSQASANGDDEGMGIDYEYSQALSELRVDLNAVD